MVCNIIMILIVTSVTVPVSPTKMHAIVFSIVKPLRGGGGGGTKNHKYYIR